MHMLLLLPAKLPLRLLCCSFVLNSPPHVPGSAYPLRTTTSTITTRVQLFFLLFRVLLSPQFFFLLVACTTVHQSPSRALISAFPPFFFTFSPTYPSLSYHPTLAQPLQEKKSF